MTSLTSVCIDPGVICEHNLFTAGSVGSVQVMVAMLLLHAGVALQAAVELQVAAPIHQLHRAGRHGGRARSCSAAAAQNALAEQRQLSAAAPVLSAVVARSSAVERGWTANLVDAWCCQATLHGPERLYPASGYSCASAVLVRPALDAVPRAVNRLNMVSTNISYNCTRVGA